jgi:hypothetical protein
MNLLQVAAMDARSEGNVHDKIYKCNVERKPIAHKGKKKFKNMDVALNIAI